MLIFSILQNQESLIKNKELTRLITMRSQPNCFEVEVVVVVVVVIVIVFGFVVVLNVDVVTQLF